MKYTADEIQNMLAQCTGSDCLYRHFLGVRYTDGARIVAKYCGAYWLLDAIASHQSRSVRQESFQVWTLHVAGKTEQRGENQVDALLICTDGNGREIVRQSIKYTDFPLDKITLWVEDGIILLPSEH